MSKAVFGSPIWEGGGLEYLDTIWVNTFLVTTNMVKSICPLNVITLNTFAAI